MEVKHKDNGTQGIFNAVDDGKVVGEMTYYRGTGNIIVINHTGVAPAYEGQGVGKKMVVAAVDYARDNDLQIVPTCPFAAAVINRMNK